LDAIDDAGDLAGQKITLERIDDAVYMVTGLRRCGRRSDRRRVGWKHASLNAKLYTSDVDRKESALIAADETFDGTWPYEARYFEGNGFRQHYIDEGPRDTGETFVLLHGEPTWGYLYRNFVPRLSALGRVVVVDQMGFGKSETPQDRSYSAQEHTENLTALLLDLDLRDITLVGQDWGGVINGQFAYRNHERVKRVVLIDSFMKAMMDPEQAPDQQNNSTPWIRFILSDDFEPVMSHLGATILSVLYKVGFTRTERITGTWVRAYGAPFPTPEECRGALQFPRNLLLPETWKYMHEGEELPGAMDAVREKPALLIQGEQDQSMPPLVAEMLFRMIWPNAPIVMLPHSGHFLQEDAPEAAVALIENFVQTTG
jgi:haloalkane dehalogenase